MVGAEERAPERRPKRRGIAPKLLLAQVEGTASWALRDARPDDAWARWLRGAPELESRWQERESTVEYLAIMLAAHFTSVATFVPTDVDTHIRHHLWQEIDDEATLARALAVVDEASAWDVRPVSARAVSLPTPTSVGRIVHGHAGEWLSVRAGALGRALTMGRDELASTIAAEIDRELTHEAEAFEEAARHAHKGPDESRLALQLATTMAHNAGDLSRVVEAWPRGTPRRDEHISRYCRLGHVDSARIVQPFRLAGLVNKAVMADENHRHLALRAPRGLRSTRALLLPLGPWFDAWGARLGRSELEPSDKADVLAALLEGYERAPQLHGYLRAIRGLHETVPGGLEGLEQDLPARLRKHVHKGPVREGLRLDEDRFAARMHNAWRAAYAAASG